MISIIRVMHKIDLPNMPRDIADTCTRWRDLHDLQQTDKSIVKLWDRKDRRSFIVATDDVLAMLWMLIKLRCIM